MRGEELALLDRVTRTQRRSLLGEERLHGRVESCREPDGRHRVETATDVPHALGIGPGRHACVALLAGEECFAVVSLQPFDLEVEALAELLDGPGRGDVGERVRPVEERLALSVVVQLLGALRDAVDVARGDRPVLQCLGQRRCRRQRVGAFLGLRRGADRAAAGLGDGRLGERLDARELADEPGLLGIGPRPDRTDIDQRTGDLVPRLPRSSARTATTLAARSPIAFGVMQRLCAWGYLRVVLVL